MFSRRCLPRRSDASHVPAHSSNRCPAGRSSPRMRHRAVIAGRSKGITAARAVRHRRQPLGCWSLRGSSLPRPVADAPQSCRRTGGTCATQLGLLAASAGSQPVTTPADWSVLFGYQFRGSDRINVLEFTALTSLVKHLANRGARRQRILCCVVSRVVLGAVSKGRSSSRRLNFGLRRLAFECLSASLSIDLLCECHLGEILRTRRGGTSLASWRCSLPTRPAQAPTVQFRSAALARELKLLREPLPEAAVRALGACYRLEDTTTVTRAQDRWRQELLLTAGDVEPNPGPTRRRPCPSPELVQTYVMSRTEALVDPGKVIAPPRDLTSNAELSSRARKYTALWSNISEAYSQFQAATFNVLENQTTS